MAAAEPTASPAQLRLDAIRNRVTSSSPIWEITAGDHLTMTAGEGGDLPEVLTFSSAVFIEDRDLVLHARDDLIWLLAIYDKLAERFRWALSEIKRLDPPKKSKDYAAECAMQCSKQAFRTFLRERHGLEATDDERINTRVRSILRIQSRADLNTDDSARERWFSLRAEFKNWQEGRA